MDRSSVIGLLLAVVGIVLGQQIEGGSLSALLQPTAALIVLSGTFGAVALQTRPVALRRGIRLFRDVFRPKPVQMQRLMSDLLNICDNARRNGTMKVEELASDMADPFIKKGLNLVADGVDAAKIREILAIDIENYEANERAAIRIYDAAGGYAPTIGIVGAVIGLIHVMEHLSDPSKLGEGIAIAFTATLYGVAIANLLFIPVAAKLKALLQQETRRREMIVIGMMCVSRMENPLIVRERLSSYLES